MLLSNSTLSQNPNKIGFFFSVGLRPARICIPAIKVNKKNLDSRLRGNDSKLFLNTCIDLDYGVMYKKMQTQTSSHHRTQSGFSQTQREPFLHRSIIKNMAQATNGKPETKVDGFDIATELKKLEVVSICEFRFIARNLLIEHPEMILEVIEKAHRFSSAQGGNELRQLLSEIGDVLPFLMNFGMRSQYLRRALRSAGRTTEFIRPRKKKYFNN